MDRRDFLKISAAAVAAGSTVSPTSLAGNISNAMESIPDGNYPCENVPAGEGDLHLKFLGTGAASGWDTDRSKRRYSSVLLDGRILIDLTDAALDMIPEGCSPKVVFYTHSHDDHYRPKVALGLGITRVYVSETWADRAREDFRNAARELSGRVEIPEVVGLQLGRPVTEQGLTFIPLPANHLTSDIDEQTLIYVIEKGTTQTRTGVRLLYATDTGGIMAKASKLGWSKSRPLTGFIMEATVGMGLEEDPRILSHSTVELAARTARMLRESGQYTPPEGQPPYATHMSSRGWARQKDLEFVFPRPLRPSYDGLEVTFRPVD